jgi:2-hydroxy-6-oxonona-2,4-dienedioate hydrolase
MSGLQLAHRWDDVRGLRMRTLVTGDPEGQPIILVHGLGLAADSLAEMAAALAPEFRVYVPDLPGFGESDHPPRPLSIKGLADALDRWCDTVGLTDAVIVGNSYGAQVVAELAAREVEEGRTQRRARAIALIGPTCDPDARTVTAQIGRWMANGQEDEGSGNPIELVGPYMKAGLRRTLKTARAATRHRIEDRLPIVDVPALIIAGELDAISPLPWTERLAGLVPDAERRVLEGGGHSMHGSHPDRLAHFVRLFVRDRLRVPAVAAGS